MELNSIQEIIEDIAEGKMVILMDDEDRENEGDLVLAAEKVDPSAINFMATHARGLICLAINEERCKKLGLEQMVKHNGTELGTAFTTSIEAAEGVTTGISAADRATTVIAAVNKDVKAEDIVQPGHIFPIKAQEGGVLTRAGHTEAGTDLAKLAGLDPSAVIVEIMNDDGTMARRADLEIFANKHDLKIGTIADLIHYRNISEKSINLVDEANIESEYGNFLLHAYEDTINGDVHIALIKGEILEDDEVMVRVQQSNTLQDVMGINEFGSRLSFSQAMKKIESEDKGVLLLLSHSESSQEILSNISFLKGQKTSKNNEGPDSRIVGVGAQILKDLGIKKIRLLGASAKYPLTGFNLEITEFIN
ncbi:MAG: bifunctional 3,4-dihydroxy-2-butanone-4-phosphate synthase/GTP cyclohydrolase II [SAR86 cluster bacterium]|jgi:3,4-dihydroxy 2-butanone 4-phosphate synthase/GTP cyclohydrolase II|nr:bifunctional 3,4-dihydroxy-2-butanone-4-phosphate synthase/GTP cyclohydrolase II [SAR86 cluster bacterium]